jgi:hypothetical protein
MGGMLILLRWSTLFLGENYLQNCAGFTHGTPTFTQSLSFFRVFDASNSLYCVVQGSNLRKSVRDANS